jgi:hypothetical protein
MACLVLPYLQEDAEAEMITGIALGLLPQVTTKQPEMGAMTLAFAGYRAAPAGAERVTAQLVLRHALRDFCRWRLGAGLDALKGAA